METYRHDWDNAVGQVDLLIGGVDRSGEFASSMPCELYEMSSEDLLENIRRIK